MALEVNAVAVEDDDSCGDLGLPRPRTRDVSEEYSELRTLGVRQLQPTSTTSGGCRGSRKPSPPRRLRPPPAPYTNGIVIFKDRGLVEKPLQRVSLFWSK
jgi:hypothetical protein